MKLQRRSRGTPRIANRLLRRVKSCCEVKATAPSRRRCRPGARSVVESGHLWFDTMDRRLPVSHHQNVRWRPGGVSTVSVPRSVKPGTPGTSSSHYLIQRGFHYSYAARTCRHQQAYLHFGLGRPTELIFHGQGFCFTQCLTRRPVNLDDTSRLVFGIEARVYLEDTDAEVVYYVNYLRFMGASPYRAAAGAGL